MHYDKVAGSGTADVAGLSAVQIRVLSAVVSTGDEGITRSAITRITGAGNLEKILGPVFKDDIHVCDQRYGVRSLYSLGMVAPQVSHDDDSNSIVYVASDLGVKASKTLKGNKKLDRSKRIPNKVLAPAVQEARKTRTYTLEMYTDEDMQEIKDRLGPDYGWIALRDLWYQMINLRKTGVLAKQEGPLPEWYREYRESNWWSEKEEEELERYRFHCSLSVDHDKDVNVWHRTFAEGDDKESVLFKEESVHLVVLCEQCRKRNRKAMIQVPEQDLR